MEPSRRNLDDQKAMEVEKLHEEKQKLKKDLEAEKARVKELEMIK
jgi:hypothetical protein